MTDSHAEQLPSAQRAHRVERVLDVLRERRRERSLEGAVQLALDPSILPALPMSPIRGDAART